MFCSDESKLAAYMGVITAIISNFQRIGDTIRSIRAGQHTFVFLLCGPIYVRHTTYVMMHVCIWMRHAGGHACQLYVHRARSCITLHIRDMHIACCVYVCGVLIVHRVHHAVYSV